MGVEAALRRVRDMVFWPGINDEIQQLIKKCKACQFSKPAHVRPSLPWVKVAADLFTLEGRNYKIMVTVDIARTSGKSTSLDKTQHQGR